MLSNAEYQHGDIENAPVHGWLLPSESILGPPFAADVKQTGT